MTQDTPQATLFGMTLKEIASAGTTVILLVVLLALASAYKSKDDAYQLLAGQVVAETTRVNSIYDELYRIEVYLGSLTTKNPVPFAPENPQTSSAR